VSSGKTGAGKTISLAQLGVVGKNHAHLVVEI